MKTENLEEEIILNYAQESKDLLHSIFDLLEGN